MVGKSNLYLNSEIYSERYTPDSLIAWLVVLDKIIPLQTKPATRKRKEF